MQDILTTAATVVEIAALGIAVVPFTLGLLGVKMPRRNRSAQSAAVQLDMFAPVPAPAPVQLDMFESEPSAVERVFGRELAAEFVPPCEVGEVAYEVVEFAPIVADPWELPAEPAPVAPVAPLYPATPYLLALPPAREVAAAPKSKRTRKPAASKPAPAPTPALPTTVRELRKLCTARGMKGAGRWTKQQCLDALAAA